MSRSAPAISNDEPIEGDFHGHPTARITSDDLWVDVLATAGPRIVRLGLSGSACNMPAETPEEGWETPYGRWAGSCSCRRAQPGPGFKLGYLNEAGWVGYARDGTVLVRRFGPLPGRSHPDLGCNTEVYIGRRYLELELLGPLTLLHPGSTVTLVETWELLATEPIGDDAAIRALAVRLDGPDRVPGTVTTCAATAIASAGPIA